MNWLMNQKSTQFIRRILVWILPSSVKALIKRALKYPPNASDKLVEVENEEPYRKIVVYPQLLKEVSDSIPGSSIELISGQRADIICFSIIDWDFRFQRPQQIMTQFANNGHRIFYISVSNFLSADDALKFSVTNIKKNIFEIALSAQQPPNIYGDVLSGENLHALFDSLAEVRRHFKIDEAISYVMIASWTPLALDIHRHWGWPVIYDCMDEWDNFPLITSAILQAELELVKKCDLLVVTAQQLYDKWEQYHRPMVLARNAVNYAFYAERCRPNEILKNPPHPLIGYYGAIADWFDVELMVYIARNRPQYTYILLGGVFNVDVSELQSLPNVKLLGQQPYESMPQYLYHFDVCIIPFKVNAITEATDPVKIYEYLSGGKPVVSVALSELKTCQELIYLAGDYAEFLLKLDAAVLERDAELVQRRRLFAQQNTWETRYEQIWSGIHQVTSKASILIVSYNNLALTRLCLDSIYRNTAYPNYEVIIVDNNSSDDSPSYLKAMSEIHDNLKVILNSTNNGFAAANNQGLELSTGEYLILLNNDTIVPPGWLSRLLHHVIDPEIGIVGSVTNAVYNEAKVEVNYSTWGQMEAFSKEYTWQNDGQIAEIHMLAMYCVAFRRDVYKDIGPLDERFGIGMFEDDDYSLRIHEKGYKVICALDAFVHHFGQASFKRLYEDGTYDALFNENRRKYEDKWQIEWQPHRNVTLSPYSHNFRFESLNGHKSTK